MSEYRQQILKICVSSLEQKGLINDDRHKDRLKKELKQIDAQGEHEYLINLYNKFQKENLIYPTNEHNLLVVYLLGLSNEFDIEQDYAWIQGEMPDVDIDYLKDVRDYLKSTWAKETFGQEMICEIGTYGTSGIRGALLDMARVHDESNDEIQSITKKIPDKDEEGEEIEWDKALEMSKELKDYCDSHPDVASAAHLLLERNRSGGVHAGGLIISDRRIDGFVPLEVRKVNKEYPNGVVCSAWTEGLNRQDLQPVGLIKFDLLVINNLKQIAIACKLIRDRHGVESICALPNDLDWSDTSYLNDPKSIEMANSADLKGVFQFDSDGMRKMVKRGGVTCFDDLAAYSALYRPGCLKMSMDAHYCDRKNGKEEYEIHPILQKSLGYTYGIMVYQEQIMDILRIVGRIPDMFTEKVRKAISKKKIKDIVKYKDMFIENGQKVLNTDENSIKDLFDLVQAFSEYGFNKSHAYAYTYISSRLLWIKSHYPIEFYTSLLMCEGDMGKFKEYKLDAEKHGIPVCPVHINNSKKNFSICDDKIYFGFSNIKGIGDEVANRIVENQPYKDIADFIDRFGVEITPIKALTALGVFEDNKDRLYLRKFAEWHKDLISLRKVRKQRFKDALVKKDQELKNIILEKIDEQDPDFKILCEFTDRGDCLRKKRFDGMTKNFSYKQKGEIKYRDIEYDAIFDEVIKRREKTILTFHQKEEADDERTYSVKKFNPNDINIDEEEVELLTNEVFINGKKTYPLAEKKYYDFSWTHILETSPDYIGNNFDYYMSEVENGMQCGPVEVQIVSVLKRKSKKGNDFYSVQIEDANGKVFGMNVWESDYNQFEDEFVAGNLVRIQVTPPNGGFSTFTFKSYPKHQKRLIPPKHQDYRLVLIRLPENTKMEAHEEILQISDIDEMDEIEFDISAIDILD